MDDGFLCSALKIFFSENIMLVCPEYSYAFRLFIASCTRIVYVAFSDVTILKAVSWAFNDAEPNKRARDFGS
jgi:hypothetical protein